jgi:hypothetical protein
MRIFLVEVKGEMTEVKLKVKLKHIKSALLTIDGREPIKVEWLGRGRFSEAWGNCENAYVITREREWGTDSAKELMESLLDLNNPHIPKVEHVGYLGDSKVFRMPLYQPLTAKNKEAWGQFKELRRNKEDAWNNFWPSYGRHDAAMETMRYVVDSSSVPLELREGLQAIVDASYSYMDLPMLEFSKKNLTVDAEGRLILLDVIFDIKVNDSFYDARRKRYERRY